MKCKVGDLAWYRGKHAPAKNCLFEIVAPAPNRIARDWEARSIFGPIAGTLGIPTIRVYAHDADLDPIRPPKITETETTDELEGVL